MVISFAKERKGKWLIPFFADRVKNKYWEQNKRQKWPKPTLQTLKSVLVGGGGELQSVPRRRGENIEWIDRKNRRKRKTQLVLKIPSDRSDKLLCIKQYFLRAPSGYRRDDTSLPWCSSVCWAWRPRKVSCKDRVRKYVEKLRLYNGDDNDGGAAFFNWADFYD